MRIKVNKVLLIDDNEAINFIHRYILEELDFVSEIVTKENGEDAIHYLLSLIGDSIPLPELIFIDINMPRMNAWEFMEEYKKIDTKLRKESFVFLLTSSIDPADIDKAKRITEIEEVRDKPFDEKMLTEIVEKYLSKAKK